MLGIARKYLNLVVMACAWTGAGILSILILLIVYNVLSRAVFRKPFLGLIEMVELLTLVVVFFALAYTEVRKAHVHVGLVVDRFPKKARETLAIMMAVLSAAYYFVMAWQGGLLLWSYLFPLSVTNVLGIPFSPFMFVLALGSLLLGLEILLNRFSEPVLKDNQQAQDRGDL